MTDSSEEHTHSWWPVTVIDLAPREECFAIVGYKCRGLDTCHERMYQIHDKREAEY